MVIDMSIDARELAAIRVAKALADPTRFRLLRAIAERTEISCQELTTMLPLAQATVSHHLRVLADAGLVSARHEGQFHYYRVVPEALDAHGRALAAAFPAHSRGRGGGR